MDLEDQQRFTVKPFAEFEDATLSLVCDRCGDRWAEFDGPVALAELNQRADQHAEVCR